MDSSTFQNVWNLLREREREREREEKKTERKKKQYEII